jgi:hypothetical protein
MNEQKRKSFLLRIADEVEKLVVNQANRKVFERYTREFHKKLAGYEKSEKQRQQKIAEYRKKSFKDERLRDKKSGPTKKGYVWYDDSYLRTGDPDKGFWGPRCKELPPYPGLKLRPVSLGGISPRNHKEELERDYPLLAIIHDSLLKSCAPISKDIWSVPLVGLVGCLDFNLNDEEQTIIETALEYVKADLPRRWRIGAWIKKIPHWIYILVLFLASLLTCIYIMWWLWTTFWKK